MFRAMRLVTYRSERGARAGLLRDGGVLDGWDALGGEGSSVATCSTPAGSRSAAAIAAATPCRSTQVELLPPVPDPDKLICIGLNYRAHAAEAGIEPPAAPDLLRQVPQRAGRRRARRSRCRRPATRSTTRPRWRSSSGAARRTSPRPTPSTTSRATRSSTTSPRATCSSRPRSGCPARCSTARRPCGPALVTPDEAGAARRDLLRADAERRADAGVVDRRPGLLDPGARRAPLHAS